MPKKTIARESDGSLWLSITEAEAELLRRDLAELKAIPAEPLFTRGQPRPEDDADPSHTVVAAS